MLVDELLKCVKLKIRKKKQIQIFKDNLHSAAAVAAVVVVVYNF